MKAEQPVAENQLPSVLPSIKTEQALLGRITETLNELADLLDRAVKFPELKEREELTDRITGIKRELSTLKSRIDKQHNLPSAVRTFNRVYLQLNQLQQDILSKENTAVWNKENRKRAINKPNKYEQAMEQVVERDHRIKLLSEEVKTLANQGNEYKQLYEQLIQQHHFLRNAMARNQVEGSNIVSENRQLHQRILQLMETLEDTTLRLESMDSSDKENRVLLEKGAAQIKKLSEELQESERCTVRYEKILEGRENDIKELSKILASKQAELIGKDHELSNRHSEIKHLNTTIAALEQGVLNIREEYRAELQRERRSHALELDHAKKDGGIILDTSHKQHELTVASLKREHLAEVTLLKSELAQLNNDLQREKYSVGELMKWETEARQLREFLERTKHELGNTHMAEEATRATAVYWQEECGRAKEQLRNVGEQLNKCSYELERRVADSVHNQTVKDIKISDLQHELKERLREREDATKTIDGLKTQLASLSDERQRMAEQKNKHMAEYLTEQSLRKTCEAKLNGVSTQAEQYKQQRVAIERELQRTTRELVTLEKSRIDARSQADNEKLCRLRAQKQCQSLEAVINKLRIEINQSAEEVATLRTQLKKRDTEVKDRLAQNRRLETQLSDLERQNQELKRKEQELQGTIRGVAEQERASRERKDQDHYKNNQVMMEYIRQLECVKHEYEQYRASMEEKIVYLNSLIDKLNRNVEDLEYCIVQNAELREYNEVLVRQMHKLQEDGCQLQEQLDRWKDENQLLSQQLSCLREQSMGWREQNSQLKEHLNRTISLDESRIEQLTSELDRLREQMKSEAPKDVVRFNRRRILEDIRRLINE